MDSLNSGQVVGCTVVDIQYWRVVREPSLFDFQASIYLIAEPEMTLYKCRLFEPTKGWSKLRRAIVIQIQTCGTLDLKSWYHLCS